MTYGLSHATAQSSRNTRRKKLIREALDFTYAGRPVLLDELRWAVRLAESSGDNTSGSMMTRSWLNSFARTLREQFSEYAIHKIPIKGATPIGLVARTALYRLKDLDELNGFFNAENPCILCRFRTNMEFLDEQRFTMQYVTPQYHVATFRFFEERPAGLTYDEITCVPGTLIPATHKLSLVVPPGVEVDVLVLAAVPWKLFGYFDLNDWYEVDANDRLEAVERNRRW